MSKQKTAERRKAQDIRCQVKKEYEDKLTELQRRVVEYKEIIQKKDERIKELERELYKAQHRHNTPQSSTDATASLLMAGFGGYSKVVQAYMDSISSASEPSERNDSPE